MTMTTPASTTTTTTTTSPEFRLVAVDVYKDIHKGIRAELFSLTEQAGQVDPADRDGRADVATRVHSAVDLLVSHAAHEDAAVQPAIEAHLPALAEEVAGDHDRLERWMEALVSMADDAVAASPSDHACAMHRLYLELASFTGSYLAHQDLEERDVMIALEDAIGVEAVLGIHGAIIAGIPPEEMASSLAIMLPAMNVDDRTALLGGMRASAPAEVFAGVWGLARTVLSPTDHAAVGRRLDLA